MSIKDKLSAYIHSVKKIKYKKHGLLLFIYLLKYEFDSASKMLTLHFKNEAFYNDFDKICKLHKYGGLTLQPQKVSLTTTAPSCVPDQIDPNDLPQQFFVELVRSSYNISEKLLRITSPVQVQGRPLEINLNIVKNVAKFLLALKLCAVGVNNFFLIT